MPVRAKKQLSRQADSRQTSRQTAGTRERKIRVVSTHRSVRAGGGEGEGEGVLLRLLWGVSCRNRLGRLCSPFCLLS